MSNRVIFNIGKENNPFGAFSDAEFSRVMESADRRDKILITNQI